MKDGLSTETVIRCNDLSYTLSSLILLYIFFIRFYQKNAQDYINAILNKHSRRGYTHSKIGNSVTHERSSCNTCGVEIYKSEVLLVAPLHPTFNNIQTLILITGTSFCLIPHHMSNKPQSTLSF